MAQVRPNTGPLPQFQPEELPTRPSTIAVIPEAKEAKEVKLASHHGIPLDLPKFVGYESLDITDEACPVQPGVSLHDISVSVPDCSPSTIKLKFTDESLRKGLVEEFRGKQQYDLRAATKAHLNTISEGDIFTLEMGFIEEKRYVKWCVEPLSDAETASEEKESSANTPPLPWDVEVDLEARSSQSSASGGVTVPIPRTSVIRSCHRCNAVGSFLCGDCGGRGYALCLRCQGTGTTVEPAPPTPNSRRPSLSAVTGGSPKRSTCVSCRGQQHYKCDKCAGARTLCCDICRGHRNVKCTILLTNEWRTITIRRQVSPCESWPSRLLIGKTQSDNRSIYDADGLPASQQLQEISAAVAQNAVEMHEDAQEQALSRWGQVVVRRFRVTALHVAETEMTWRKQQSKFWSFGHNANLVCRG
eukprot:TRINITY_DN3772_c0_g1_i2.p1 TRINITY_DN3772_c0_g1~~TRINITY_DN3772_c0_g1_i2.p1  ORF type:complete len:416 (+),score=42.98 TRINITY_DN3772_c0_g1_i2:207-1454(+)